MPKVQGSTSIHSLMRHPVFGFHLTHAVIILETSPSVPAYCLSSHTRKQAPCEQRPCLFCQPIYPQDLGQCLPQLKDSMTKNQKGRQENQQPAANSEEAKTGSGISATLTL